MEKKGGGGWACLKANRPVYKLYTSDADEIINV